MEQPQSYYEKTLTITDIEQKLILLNHWLDDDVLPIPNPGSEAIPISFRDEFGHDYVFRLKVRSLNLNQPRYYMKPEFEFREWHAFVVEKQLQVGQSIYLWRDDMGHRRIKVRDPPRLHVLSLHQFLTKDSGSDLIFYDPPTRVTL